jgi:hypothetical protein
MGGYAPDPAALSVLKAFAYSGFGWMLPSAASDARKPFVFALIRVAAGVAVGIAFAFGVVKVVPGLSDAGTYLLFQLPRLFLWAVLLQLWFRPRDAKVLLLWTIAGTALSIALDLIAFQLFDDIDWLRIGIC